MHMHVFIRMFLQSWNKLEGVMQMTKKTYFAEEFIVGRDVLRHKQKKKKKT